MGQLDLFTFSDGEYKIKKPIRLTELFAGVGSQAMALRDLGKKFEHHRVVEFDKHAIASYNAIHRTNFPVMDITQIKGKDLGIEDTKYYDYIMTYSFPCQDLSIAGKQKGMVKGSGTRSGLLWEVERLLLEGKELPQVLLMENVPQVHADKNLEDFNNWITFLHSIGYNNFYQDLNAKDYEVPQSRNRCFMISLLGNYDYSFPSTMPLKKNIKSILEKNVDEQYFLHGKKVDKLLKQLFIQNYSEQEILFSKVKVEARMDNTIDHTFESCNRVYNKNGISPNLLTREQDAPKVICLNTKSGRNGIDGLEPSFQNRVYSTEGVAPALSTGFKTNFIDTVQIKQATKEGYIDCKIGGVADLSYPDSKTRRGRVIDNGDVSPTLMTGENNICKIESPYRIRKLTPLECWRLMGFTDEDFRKAESVNNNTQLYKQAGNSIVKNVLMAIFNQLF